MTVVLVIFLLTYTVIAIGYLPGFRIDRTGAALLGAIAMIVIGGMSPDQAWDSADFGTLALLFGLMVVSGAFYVAGFYHWVAVKIGRMDVRPEILLAAMIGVSTALSSLLTNDVVVVAMTPLLIEIALGRRLNPIPFLLAFAFASNAGSAGSMIGSPQNIIIAGQMKVSFTQFLVAGLVPALLSMPVIWGAIVLLYRGRWTTGVASQDEPDEEEEEEEEEEVVINRLEIVKASVVLAAVLASFLFAPWPYPVVALTAAGVLLLNRRAIGVSSSDLLSRVDGSLLLLVFSLYVINGAFSMTDYPEMVLHWLAGHGFDLHDPHVMLVVISLLSDLADNNSAVLLLTPYADTSQPLVTTAALALGAGFSSNIVNFGSLAGIIVVEGAARQGVKISFMEFFRAGVIVGVACLLIAAAWIAVLQGMA
ncbi:SLC13 family permease [Altererythrobacter sp. Root672]|uniref:SLC13 family permease n=1 Tax=Altererythrobacter sp. Root672 TaxID=1736584 RepID=UPI0006F42603|nr:SLC13 family permease [Altererythrobacter sp. Root672]KRA81421.1 transporter [Altererythrobacter sp. Root672]